MVLFPPWSIGSIKLGPLGTKIKLDGEQKKTAFPTTSRYLFSLFFVLML